MRVFAAQPINMVSRCFIPGWNFYWFFPALRGLAKEFNEKFDREDIAAERINLDLVTWMLICALWKPITFGVSADCFHRALDHVYQQDQERSHRRDSVSEINLSKFKL